MSDSQQSERHNVRSRSRISVDLEACENLIADALEEAISIDQHVLTVIRSSRCALDQRTWTCELEAAMYAAVDVVRATVYYPNARVWKDLKHADELISHAALAGIQLAQHDIEAVSEAQLARKKRDWAVRTEAAFYFALGRIAHIVLPVEAETAGPEALRGARRAIKVYSYWTIPLIIVVVGLSCALFIANQLSEDVSKLVSTNDIEAMKLHNELESHATSIIEAQQKGEREIRRLKNDQSVIRSLLPGEDSSILEAKQKTESELRLISNSQTALQIKDTLQQFATNNRQLYNDVQRTRGIGAALLLPVNNPYYNIQDCAQGEVDSVHAVNVSDPRATQKINWICDTERIRANLEITVPMLEADHVLGEKDGQKNESLNPENDVDEGFQKIAAYQDIRAMAMYGRDIILSLVGIVTGFVLPVLYAWLGACAAILRKINVECASNTFHPENSKVANRAHVTCAVIVGIAIGLLSDLIEGGKSLSPLAIAFIAGYASNKFFYFVDRLVDSLFPTQISDKKVARNKRISERGATVANE
jgi:HAMP domain-containing protein